MALSIDKEALLEFLGKNKDPLFVSILALILVVGGWFLYQQSSQTAGQIIDPLLKQDDRSGRTGGAGGTAQAKVTAEQVVGMLLDKRNQEVYSSQRNPFGSPEDQLRMRQEVQSVYDRAVNYFKNKDYEAALTEFDKVIALDVTETRIPYPVTPSEYKLLVTQQNLKENLDKILQNAQTDIAEGDRLAQSGNAKGAMEVYERANDNLMTAINSDPDGKVVGEESINKVKQIQQTAFQKYVTIRGQSLKQEYNLAINQSQQILGGSDYIEMLRVLNSLVLIQSAINSVDPNAQIIAREERTRLGRSADEMVKKLQDNFTSLTDQAKRQFEQALSENDPQKTKEAITVLRSAASFNLKNDAAAKTLKETISSFVNRRAQLVIKLSNAFAAEQETLLNEGNYEQFKEQAKNQYVAELKNLKEAGAALDLTTRKDLDDALVKVNGLKLPPPVTDSYFVKNVTRSSGNNYKFEVTDKTGTSPKPRIFRLKEGARDRTTGITLKQVDTDQGFVILSKPKYLDAKVNITSSN